MSDDLQVIACNSTVDEAEFSRGSLAYVQLLASDRARVLIRSRSGRWIETWRAINTLGNFRIKLLPLEHPLYSRVGEVGSPEFFSEESVAVLIRAGAGQGLRLR